MTYCHHTPFTVCVKCGHAGYFIRKKKLMGYLTIGGGIYILTAAGIWVGVDLLGFSGLSTSLVWGGVLVMVKWFWYKNWGVVES